MKLRSIVIIVAFFGVATVNLAAQSGLNDPANPYELELSYELGAVKVLKNTLQIGADSTDFNFVTRGGEEILFPFQRFSGNLSLGGRHNIVLLYQPLEIVTTVAFRSAVKIDTVHIP